MRYTREIKFDLFKDRAQKSKGGAPGFEVYGTAIAQAVWQGSYLKPEKEQSAAPE